MGQEGIWEYHPGTCIEKEKTNFHKIFIDEIQNVITTKFFFFSANTKEHVIPYGGIILKLTGIQS